MRDTTSSKNSKSNKESISIEKINKCYSLALLKSFVNATNLDEFKYQYVKKIEYLKRREELRVKVPHGLIIAPNETGFTNPVIWGMQWYSNQWRKQRIYTTSTSQLRGIICFCFYYLIFNSFLIKSSSSLTPTSK